MYRIGALDFSVVHKGAKPSDVLWETLDLVPSLESYGYERFWIGEHHSHEVAHSSPEILVPVIAGTTSRMRVGPAGILLNYYRPLKIAQEFRLLSALFPNRIDLGIARGAAVGPIAEHIEISETTQSSYGEKINQLMNFLRGKGPVTASPVGIPPPEVWILGHSCESAKIAAQNGVAYCLGLFAQQDFGTDWKALCHMYRSSFSPSDEQPEPRLALAVAGVCSESHRRAVDLISHNRVFPGVVGDPRYCSGVISDLGREYDIKEFVFLDMCQEFRDRTKSFELLADALQSLPTQP